jgi:hypothetical protein
MGVFVNISARIEADSRTRLVSSGSTSDGTSVYLLGATVLKVSPRAFPNVIREMTQKAKLAREALGQDLGRVIPTPLSEWEAGGSTCALFEELAPVSSARLKRFMQVNRVKPHVLSWLRNVASIDGGVSSKAALCLEALAECPDQALRDAADQGLARLRACDFVPKSRVMHGDFWIGNVMLDPSALRDFLVIDWRGSAVDGFPIFDLVKFAQSVKLPPYVLRRELAEHAERLECDIQDTRTYLLAALGYIWLNLEQFPPERFLVMAARNLDTLERALCA